MDLNLAHCAIGAIKMTQKQSLFKETPHRTPLKSRPYLRSSNAHFTPFSHSARKIEQHKQQQDFDEMEYPAQIYGTNINIMEVMNKVQKFIVTFEKKKVVEEQVQFETIYRSQLLQMYETDSTLFEIDGRDIYEADKKLYMQFIYYPAEMITCFDNVLKDLYQRYCIDQQTNQTTKLREKQKKERLMLVLKHLHQTDSILIKNLNPTKIGKLVSIQGIVIRASEIYPQMKGALFRCSECSSTVEIQLQNARVAQPRSCPKCLKRECMQIEHNLSSFTDKQYVKFQELPQFVTEGETPSSITILAYDSNVDGFRPGDRVQVIGIYRATSKLVQRHRTQLQSIFNTYIDMISFSLVEEKHHKISSLSLYFTDEEKRRFRNMADSPTIWEDLSASFAPSIFQHETVKKGLLAQLFGGTRKKFEQIGRNRFRSDINICLLGDPSTAKSQLLQQVHKISSRSIYTSGRGSSAVGLTANVRKDPQTREFILQSGALVLSDQGICCIDQFDKMDQNSRTILLEAMQQQTISIAKAGIVCQLNSRTAILAAANPVNSKYDDKKSVVENINLPPALLSRFDLIYLMLDTPNEHADRRLATHILNIYSAKSSKRKRQEAFELKDLARYITYAREYISPSITEDAAKMLKTEYIKMRANGQSRNTISATPRQLESLIRISQAFAKMRLSRQVTEQDVMQSIELMNAATLKSATDPDTGIINMETITTGKSASIRKREEEVAAAIRSIILANQSIFKNATSLQKLQDHLQRVSSKEKGTFTKSELVNGLKLLETQDLIVVFGENRQKPQFKLHRNRED